MSSPEDTVFNSDLRSLERIARGKVRDMYAIDDERMLIVTTDRISAFDVVLPTPIPGKGRVLTAVSNFWFARMTHLIPNHLTGVEPESVVTGADEQRQVAGRSVVVRKLRPLPVEAIVRGFIAGSGWKDYQRTGAICGIELPPGLRQADQLPQAIYTPSTKAEVGEHDENVSFEHTVKLLGTDLAQRVRDVSLAIYAAARDYAAERGILIADTKFEFGLDDEDRLYLIDEALTPDSSRFWPAAEHRPGESPPSFDKQFVRDYLETLDWDKRAPGPALPDDIASRTAQKYAEALRLLTR